MDLDWSEMSDSDLDPQKYYSRPTSLPTTLGHKASFWNTGIYIRIIGWGERWCLRGSVLYGESVEDEWMAVGILAHITQHISSLGQARNFLSYGQGFGFGSVVDPCLRCCWIGVYGVGGSRPWSEFLNTDPDPGVQKSHQKLLNCSFFLFFVKDVQ